MPAAASQALGVEITTFRGTAHIGLHATHATCPISTSLQTVSASPSPNF
jgi:hypothetical protein